MFIRDSIKNVEEYLNEIKKIYENGFTELENVEQLTISYSSLKNSLDYAVKVNKTSLNL